MFYFADGEDDDSSGGDVRCVLAALPYSDYGRKSRPFHLQSTLHAHCLGLCSLVSNEQLLSQSDYLFLDELEVSQLITISGALPPVHS